MKVFLCCFRENFVFLLIEVVLYRVEGVDDLSKELDLQIVGVE